MSSPILQLDGVMKSYDALLATNNVSLDVVAGEIHALIGPNGAGKTTLIKQIYGSERPDSGRILLNGEDITSLSVPKRVRKGIGRSFQISNVLTDFTMRENAIIAAQAQRQEAFQFFLPAFDDASLIEDAMVILDAVGLTPKADILVSELAHGERRLLELALAMAGEPCLLLLDEPMAGAGPQESQYMTDIISALRARHGILLIEHDMDAVFALADRITVLVEGAVIAHGASAEISQNPAVREAYLGREDEAC
ncbi:ABC transporter ATP-binding protein [Alphaproteobacteria bacterium]|nr:ABC transporter ATP-binding protein [Alphaproteobacteria bacterium]